MLRSKRFLLSAVLIVVCISRVAISQTPPKRIKIRDATLVRLSLKDSLTSATNRVDDPVRFEVTEDVKVGDLVVIPEGATASGHVVEARPKAVFGRSGKLNFTVDHVEAPDGTSVRLRATSTQKEDSSGSLLMAPFSLVLGGKDISIPKGTQFNTYVDGDQEITLGPPAGSRDTPPAAQPAAPPNPQEPSTVVVKSTPEGADITVDGRYMGNTPSTLQLAPGEHTVSIDRPGYRQWQRVMSVTSGGIITIDARLEAQ